MRTVITSSGDNVSSQFDKRFGRAEWFCIYDNETGEITFKDNKNINASNGAGTKAAETMAEFGIKKVISGDFGPKAKNLLDKLGVQMVIIQDEEITIEDIINKLKR